jgi:uncharacterized protein
MKRIIAAPILLTMATPAWAGWDEGLAAWKRGDYATALREFRPLAEQGFAEAQHSLGRMYYKGHGVTQDYCLGIKTINAITITSDRFVGADET